jgi:aminoglycoside 2'-N-acetyltransferase I
MLTDAFDGDLSDSDWEHSLGGMHATAWENGEVIGHAAVVQRRMLHRGRALRTGYVEGVAVRADQRGRGVGGAVMAPLERIIRAAYDLGALAASDMAVPLYTGRGWQLWQGPSSALTPDGVTPTGDDDGGIYVLPVVPVDVTAGITCDWRDGDVW